ncbi:metallophosphoesterase family protein [Larkinella terrae]|uniref:Phosphoesterase n=1 Tax=Larkinella terrae TaxID=2025311 RepID=A0A7K0EUI3_9BACT|nr:metallophosphoesterase family protein [Larkinella terrae]MRS65473.1 YfcE family phosphodiesterase [Larkinella terrae]
MIRIGLLSDTHGFLDPQIFTHFAQCDEIWHAGDVGSVKIIDDLKAFKPFRGVFGNIDDKAVAYECPENQRFELEGLSVWMTHIGGTPPRYNPIVRPDLLMNPPDVFVCGHSHILKVVRDPKINNLLFINPGAAGKHGFHSVRTCLRFGLDAGRITNMEVIELGTR